VFLKRCACTNFHVYEQMMEKCRFQMQQQFDQWYSNLHSRTDLMSLGHFLANSDGSGSASSSVNNAGSAEANPVGDMYMTQEMYDGRHGQPGGRSNGNARSPRAQADVMNAQTTVASGVQTIAPASQRQAFPTSMLRASNVSSSSSAPNNERNTSNVARERSYKDLDDVRTNSGKGSSVPAPSASPSTDDVNEDIAAFYQARDDLLKRRAAGGR
jgi:hypothetical protein